MRGLDAVLATLVLVTLVAALAHLAGPNSHVTGAVRVIDGDTIRLGGHTIRFIGMDAPELAQRCGTAEEQPCGVTARNEVVRLIGQGEPTCEIVGHDRYRRDLGRCTAAAQDIGGTLVREGLAVAYGGYGREEAEARSAHRGLWAAPFERPSDWRKAHPRSDFRDRPG